MAAESNPPHQPPSQAGTDTAPRKPDPICAVIARTRHDMIHAEVMEAARRNVMLAELRSEVASLVVRTTAKVAGKLLTDDDQRRLTDEASRELAA